MKRFVLFFLLAIGCLLLADNNYAQQEQIQILTYYPAPYGVYRDIQAQRIWLLENGNSTQSNVYLQERTNASIRRVVMYGTVATSPPNDTFGFIVTPTGTTPRDVIFNLWENDNDADPNIRYAGFRVNGASDGSLRIFTADEGTATAGPITFVPDDDLPEVMRITTGGNVGIGTITPVDPNILDISRSRNDQVWTRINNPFNPSSAGASTTAPTEAGLTLQANGNDALIFAAAEGRTDDLGFWADKIGVLSRPSSRGIVLAALASNGTIEFVTGTTDPNPPHMTIASNGRVGIGTINPTDKLHVVATGTDVAIHGQGSSTGVYGESSNDAGIRGYGTGFGAHGVYGEAVNGFGVYGVSTNTIGVYGQSTINAGVEGWSQNHIGVLGISNGSQPGVVGQTINGPYAFRADAGWTSKAYGPFTGAHDIKFSNNIKHIEPGSIVISDGKVEIKEGNFSSILPSIKPVSKENDKRVFGVFITEWELPEGYWYKPIENEKFGVVNALGEGMVLVTDINGPLVNGDYVTSSSIPGYGQKQNDDLMHSYTVGKVVQDVDWNSITDTIEHNGKKYKKCLIAVTYHCG